MTAQRRKKRLESGTAWQWFLLGGILVLLLIVMAFGTVQQVRHGRDLMSAHIGHQGEMLLRSMEQATRAYLRRGIFGQQLLQNLAEEMLEDKRVKSVTILDPQGGILALGRLPEGKDDLRDPLGGLPLEVKQAIAQREHVERFIKNEFVLGRVFDPMRPGRDRSMKSRAPFSDSRRKGDDRKLAKRKPGRDDQMPRRRGMMMMRDLPPWLRPPHMQEENNQMPYALVRLSTTAMTSARSRALRGAVIMGGLIFAAAAVAAWGMWAAARKRSREIDLLKAEVAESGHMAAVGRLAASVAHEVRNPFPRCADWCSILPKISSRAADKPNMPRPRWRRLTAWKGWFPGCWTIPGRAKYACWTPTWPSLCTAWPIYCATIPGLREWKSGSRLRIIRPP
jgi:hypothetical protein